jgi:hypothetical protein
MTGPEHYTKAEQLLADAAGHGRLLGELARAQREAAQAHATLALAAATAMQHYNFEVGMNQDDRQAWLRTVSEYPAAQARRREAEQAELREFAEEQASPIPPA